MYLFKLVYAVRAVTNIQIIINRKQKVVHRKEQVKTTEINMYSKIEIFRFFSGDL